jgi:hypothetical protein
MFKGHDSAIARGYWSWLSTGQDFVVSPVPEIKMSSPSPVTCVARIQSGFKVRNALSQSLNLTFQRLDNLGVRLVSQLPPAESRWLGKRLKVA